MTPKEAIDNIMWTPLMRSPNEHGELKEALYMACNALEKADKYAWHDLRKDPNDLPPHGRIVIVLTEGFGFGASLCTYTIGHWNEDKEEWRFDSVAYPIPIAWREIEPFEIEPFGEVQI